MDWIKRGIMALCAFIFLPSCATIDSAGMDPLDGETLAFIEASGVFLATYELEDHEVGSQAAVQKAIHAADGYLYMVYPQLGKNFEGLFHYVVQENLTPEAQKVVALLRLFGDDIWPGSPLTD